jgi:tetratricopeptide (TPR) repeat protein
VPPQPLALIIVAAIFILTPAARTQSDDPDALIRRVSEPYQAGKYAEAIPLAGRYAEAMKSLHRTKDPEYATALEWLAELYRAQGRYPEAEPLYKRVLASNA